MLGKLYWKIIESINQDLRVLFLIRKEGATD